MNKPFTFDDIVPRRSNLPKLAIHGKAGAGKSTLADYLVGVWGYDAVAFAYNLKLDLINMGVPAGTIKTKPWPQWLRVLAQLYGAAKRQTNKAYWIARLHSDIEQMDTARPVIEDMRYENEAAWARNAGFRLIKVVKMGETYDDPHPSEVELDNWTDWDCVIEVWPGDLVDMYKQIDDYLIGVMDASD